MHSMAISNLDKSKETTPMKVASTLEDHFLQESKSPFIKFSKTVSYEVNLAAQSSHSEVLLLSRVWSETSDFDFCG